MTDNEYRQIIKLFQAGILSKKTFWEKMGISEALNTDEGRVALAQAMVEPIRANFSIFNEFRERNKLLQKEKERQEITQTTGRFDLI